MKKIGFVLLVVSAALVVAPRAMADQVTGSIAIAGVDDVTFNSTSIAFTNSGFAMASGSGGTLAGVSGPVALTGFDFSNPDGVELFDVTGGTSSPVTFTIEGDIAEALVNGILTITGDGLLTEAGYESNGASFDLSVSNSGQSTALEITSVAAPEPSSLVLLGTGLLCLAFALFWKAKSTGLTVHK